ncbi:MAG: hypothetical protein HQL47_11840, partial [Gammaproteobacteria bacterium]|nr:hypothetical protein [Gammaproteobacteria bacterium]
RLNLLFLDAQEQRLSGLLTRRLLRSWLQLLPEWLSKNSSLSQSQSQGHFQRHFQREMEQMQHQQAQQLVPVVENQLSLEPAAESFLIETLNMTLLGKGHGVPVLATGSDGLLGERGRSESIRLSFLDRGGEHEVILVLNLLELHKLMGEMLLKVADWDLPNPWLPDPQLHAAGSGLLALH